MATRHLPGPELSVAGLGEPGDPNAPPGSQPWAIAVRLEVQGALSRHDWDVVHLKQTLHLLRQHEGYKRLYDRRGRPFASYRAFCLEPRPWGLGEDPEHIETLIAERMTAQERAQQALPLAEHGEIGGGHTRVGITNSGSAGGTTADYLTARIARDRKDILERMQAGEFKSVRAAAREAGLVPRRVTVPVVPRRAAWLIRKHFTAQEVDELVALLRTGAEQERGS